MAATFGHRWQGNCLIYLIRRLSTDNNWSIYNQGLFLGEGGGIALCGPLKFHHKWAPKVCNKRCDP